MPNEAEKFGLPQVIIDFRTKSTTAIARSARGIGVMILNNESTNVSKFYKISDSTDIPDEGLTAKNVDLIKKALLGIPLRILVYTLPMADVTPGGGESLLNQADVLKKLHNIKWNYICHPTGTAQDQEGLAVWVKKERNIKRKTFKAVVANFDADDKGVINFTTDNIRCVNPAYMDALQAAGGDRKKVSSSIAEYLTYTSTEYTARIMGILAGLALDRSATYYELNEVYDCEVYEDIDDCISKGQLCLIDEMDGNGVKIARACNSLHTFTTDVGQDFRYIKIVETVDMITDDIRDTFKNSYVGKVINDYNHKMLFIAAILVYFRNLKGNVLDDSPTAINTVDIDEAAQKDYAILHGDDVTKMTVQQIREYNTGTQVLLTGRVTPVNAMEDLRITFTM
nr:MAG TPA: tail protein [Caudoviricetes sp.]